MTLGSSLSPELLARVRAIQIRTRRLVTDLMAGEYESAFKGRGMEFEEVREYQPGDDIRHIDWNVTARTGRPHVKEHREERELTVLLVVDVSSSGAFGSHERFKQEVAAEVAAVLAWAAIRSNDRVGLVLTSDRVERYIPPKKGRAHVWRVIREILGFRPAHRGTDLQAALEFVGRVTRRRAVVFLLSDFLDEGWQERLRTVARRHDVTAIVVVDQREAELPPAGILQLEDAESGELLEVDTLDPRVRRALEEAAREHSDRLEATLRSAGAGRLVVHAGEPWVDGLVRFFRARERRWGGGVGR